MGRERTIGAAQTALAVLVVGGTALGALLLRPGTDLLAKGRGPLGGNPALVVGLALAALLGGLALRDKYLEKVGAAGELSAVERRMAKGVSRVLLAATLIVPVLVVVLHQFSSSGRGRKGGRGPIALPGQRDDPLPTPPPAQQGEHAGQGLHFGLTRILLGLGIALLVVVVVIAGLRLWRHLTRPAAVEVTGTYARSDDGPERLAQAVDSGRRALLDGTDARAAVIACYAAMEESLAGSGVTRRASDSPQDLLERAVAGGLPTGAAADVLTALFREARYSTHPMDGSHRDRAATALAEIADALRSRTPGPDAGTATS
ncbi:DUF4129 domain-containing protein [Streptomyces niveiscabiei]|uniref:DUF4129 domain-containing protein n=1 Tax=Streptomyces niveiscabiei TaxID=164115 RepID=UPI003EB9305F